MLEIDGNEEGYDGFIYFYIDCFVEVVDFR